MAELAPSYLYVAEYDLDMLHWDDSEAAPDLEGKVGCGTGRTAHGGPGPDGRSYLSIPLRQDERDLVVDYLHKVASSNATEKVQAETDLRRIRLKEERVEQQERMAAKEAESRLNVR